MPAKNDYERAIEVATGESIECLRDMPLDERRRITEAKKGWLMKVRSFFPIIGRGNVLRKNTVDREEVNAQVDEALR